MIKPITFLMCYKRKYNILDMYVKEIAIQIVEYYIKIFNNDLDMMLTVDINYFDTSLMFKHKDQFNLKDSNENTLGHYAIAKNDKNLFGHFLYNRHIGFKCNKYGATLHHTAMYYDSKEKFDDITKKRSFIVYKNQNICNYNVGNSFDEEKKLNNKIDTIDLERYYKLYK